MAILLTGGLGYIGSHAAVALAEAGYDAVLADDCSNSSPKVALRLKTLTGRDFPCYRIDLRDGEALAQIFREHGIEAVLHFAGSKAVGESVRLPLMYYRNNIDSTLSLLEVMERFGVGRIIFSSSATVYGTPRALPLTEDAPTGGITNPYGWTKFMIEQILTDYAAANPGFSAVLLRYFNPIGAHESGLIGEAPNGIPNNLMPYITQVAVGKRDHLSVYGNDYDTPDGTGVRDYIHVCDLAEGHAAALPYCMRHTGAAVFNLGTGRGYSVLEIVHAFEEANGVAIPYEITPRRPGDIAACYADPGKAERELGWRARRSLHDMCRDSWNWQKNNPNGYD